MSSYFRVLAVVAVLLGAAVVVPRAQEFTALAHLDLDASSIRQEPGGAIEIVLELSQPVPWRVFTLAEPRRLVMDFSEVDWPGVVLDLPGDAPSVTGMRGGAVRPGWSRLILDLDAPLAVTLAGLETPPSGPARLSLRLDPVSEAEFAARAGAPESAVYMLPQAAQNLPPPRRRQDGVTPLVVALDPGHGGVDPGAERAGLNEADLMLGFALELQDVLRRSGMTVILTRDEDVFVSLEARVTAARAGGVDVFLSLHADALAEGAARGATIYTLSDRASDVASAVLAARHDRTDLLVGVDLAEQDDRVAGVLMDMARTETAPRSERLADALVAGLGESVGGLHKRPRLSAGFSVLKAPDIPSVLIELGFLSSPKDRTNLTDPAWRAKAAAGIRDALLAWAAADAAEAALLRQ